MSPRCFVSTCFAGWILLGAALVQAEFPVPPNARSFEDTGTLEGVQGSLLQIRDSKSDLWVMSIVDDTKIRIEGEAERDYLRPGVYVQFKVELDKRGAAKEPIKEIEVTPALGKASVGVFPPDDVDGLRPVRSVAAGEYLVKGKIATLRDDQLVVMAGRQKIACTLSDEELAVKLNMDDLSLAKQGDAIKIKAYYYDNYRPNPSVNAPGKGLAEEVTVTLAKPLEGSGKKKPERAARPASKSRVSK
ncbi:MAG TPA: hypothetical protein VL175_03000 [Pirellulales bacterium]|jgi:hypothetical protein|nr:hypothetical protein [Pirellulales bacterium]